MFTLAQIDDLHARLGRADTLGEYLRALAAIGVVRSETFVSDGHTEYVGVAGDRVVSPAQHPTYVVAEVSDRAAFATHLERSAAGETSYEEMSEGLAARGVERWVADTAAVTMSYVDRAGVVLLVERV